MHKATLGIFMATAILGFASQAKASDAEVKEMVNLINQERAAKGLRSLAESSALNGVSRNHSADMVKSGFFSHESPNTGSPTDRLRAAGIRFQVAGENIAMDVSIGEAHKHLMQSPGHRRNILLPDINSVGIGVVRSGRHIYVTQTFAKLAHAPAAVAAIPAPAPAAPPPAAAPAPIAPAPAAPPPVAAPPAPIAPPIAVPAPQPAAPKAPIVAAPEYPAPRARAPFPGAEGTPAPRMRPRLQVVMTPYGRMCVLNRMTVAPCGYVRRVLARKAYRAAMIRQAQEGGYYPRRMRAPMPTQPGEFGDAEGGVPQQPAAPAPRKAPMPQGEFGDAEGGGYGG